MKPNDAGFIRLPAALHPGVRLNPRWSDVFCLHSRFQQLIPDSFFSSIIFNEKPTVTKLRMKHDGMFPPLVLPAERNQQVLIVRNITASKYLHLISA